MCLTDTGEPMVISPCTRYLYVDTPKVLQKCLGGLNMPALAMRFNASNLLNKYRFFF